MHGTSFNFQRDTLSVIIQIKPFSTLPALEAAEPAFEFESSESSGVLLYYKIERMWGTLDI